MDFILRPWKETDLNNLFIHANHPHISNYMSDAFPNTIEKWKSWLDFVISDDSMLYRAIDINGEAVGGIGVTPQQDIFRKNAELGYWLSKEYWRQGIMTKAIKEIVKLAFNNFDINRIFATPFENNFASHRVLEKAGFKFEARLEKVVIKNDELLDELIYSIRKQV